MKGMIKSQWYSLKKISIIRTIFFAVLFFGIIIAATPLLENRHLTVSGLIIEGRESSEGFRMACIVLLMYFIALACVHDFTDKTVNYELMSGHSRKESYLARVLTALPFGVGSLMFIYIFSYAVFLPFLGWGSTLDYQGILVRILLVFFIFLRISCEVVLAAFILHSVVSSCIALGSVYILFVVLVIFGIPVNTYMSVFTNLNAVTNFVSWETYRIDDLSVTYSVFRAMPDMELIAGTILGSVVISIFCLISGYAFFHRDDLR